MRLLLSAILPSLVLGELETCLQALSRLSYAPYNASLPFLNGVSGQINLGYLYQKPMFAILPNEAMGSFDLCRHTDYYTSGGVKTKYCTCQHDRVGICVPFECTESDLHNKEILQPLMNLGIQTAVNVPMNCITDPYMTRECAWTKQGWEYYQGLYNSLAALGQDTPYSTGSVSCGLVGAHPSSGSYSMLAFTILATTLAILGAAWTYLAAASRKSQKERAAEVAASQPFPSPSYKPVSLNVKSPAADGQFRDISLKDGKNATPGDIRHAPEGRSRLPEQSTQDGVNRLLGLLHIPASPEWVAAFSLTSNWDEVFTLKSRAGEFACFDAMKAISAAWVVFYHVILWQIYFIQNPEYLVPPKGLLSKTWAMPFFNYSGTLSVDTFFFVSAFLASYLLLVKLDKDAARNQGESAWRWVPKLYLHRWMRITPAYAFAFFLHWKLAPLLAHGPLAQAVWQNSIKPCRHTWWAHFLYINDLYPWWNQRMGDICYGHSWYLANDMQYFLLVPLLVILYRRGASGRRLAKGVTYACLLTCIIASWALSIQHHWSGNPWDGAEGEAYRNEGFSRPWTRCSSYMIGILVSFYWYEKKVSNPNAKFLPFQANLMWVAALFLLAVSMYGPHTGSDSHTVPCNLVWGQKCGSGWSPTAKAAVIALLRPTWTIGLALLCLLCWNNQGGFIQQFLASPLWLPLSTLSFCIYLVHYTVLTFYISQRTLRIRFELFSFINIFLGLFTISAALALVVVLLVEKPFIKLQKLCFEGKAAGRRGKPGVESGGWSK